MFTIEKRGHVFTRYSVFFFLYVCQNYRLSDEIKRRRRRRYVPDLWRRGEYRCRKPILSGSQHRHEPQTIATCFPSQITREYAQQHTRGFFQRNLESMWSAPHGNWSSHYVTDLSQRLL